MPSFGKDMKQQQQLFYAADESINWDYYFQKQFPICSKAKDTQIRQVHS